MRRDALNSSVVKDGTAHTLTFTTPTRGRDDLPFDGVVARHLRSVEHTRAHDVGLQAAVEPAYALLLEQHARGLGDGRRLGALGELVLLLHVLDL